MPRRVIVAAVCLFAASVFQPVRGEEYGWPVPFTDNSSPDLVELHSELLARSLTDAPGVPVEDVHFKSDFFDMHLISGAIYLEPDVQGYPVGAFFAGEATVSFTPESPRARHALQRYLDNYAIEQMPVKFAYFHTMKGKPLTDHLGITAEPSVPLDSRVAYDACKKAFRQRGLRILHSFLNRDGRAAGAVRVLFAPESIRTGGASEAHLLYSYDPDEEQEVGLAVMGHPDAILGARQMFEKYPSYKFFFWEITSHEALTPVFKPHGTLAHYTTSLDIGKGLGTVEEETTAAFIPTPGVSALMFDLTPRLEVESVIGPNGEQLPFVQWKFNDEKPTFDDRVVVALEQPLDPKKPVEFKIASKGPLFDAYLGAHLLAEEDIWFPQLDDPEGAMFEVQASVPKNMRAVAAGSLLSEEVVEGKKVYHYATTQPAVFSTFYYGPYEVYEADAGDTKVELFATSVQDDTGGEFGVSAESPKYTATEIANAVNVYNQILGHPLEFENLRVATTPTGHGRGFEGLILLAKYGGTSSDSSAADFFRAHEVAHMWWGNMVRPKSWTEDRWLGEALAEYCAMEYYLARFQKPEKTEARIQEEWVKPLTSDYGVPIQSLTGQQSTIRSTDLLPLISGGQNVYTKGPLMVHHLRYVFKVMKKNDEVFWQMLEDFIGQYKYKQASTDDFIKVAEKHMGGRLDWFWNQWLYSTTIPEVTWSYDVTRAEDGSFLLTVNAEQVDTEYVMPIPIYVHMKGQTLDTPLLMQGKTGQRQVKLRTKPNNVTLNDNNEALVRLKKS